MQNHNLVFDQQCVYYWFPEQYIYIFQLFKLLCLQKRSSCSGYQWRTFLNSQNAKRVLKNLPNYKLLYQYNGLMYFEGLGISEVQRVCTTWNFHHLALHTPYVLKAMPTLGSYSTLLNLLNFNQKAFRVSLAGLKAPTSRSPDDFALAGGGGWCRRFRWFSPNPSCSDTGNP